MDRPDRSQRTAGVDAALHLPVAASSSSAVLSEAVGIYLTQKGTGKSVTFHRAAERACGYASGRHAPWSMSRGSDNESNLARCQHVECFRPGLLGCDPVRMKEDDFMAAARSRNGRQCCRTRRRHQCVSITPKAFGHHWTDGYKTRS